MIESYETVLKLTNNNLEGVVAVLLHAGKIRKFFRAYDYECIKQISSHPDTSNQCKTSSLRESEQVVEQPRILSRFNVRRLVCRFELAPLHA